MKRTFFTGLIILLPVAITLFIVYFCLEILTAPFIGIVTDLLHQQEYQSEALLFLARVFIVAMLFLFTLILGYLARKFFFRYLVKFMHRIFERIPIVKTIYRITKEVVENLFKVDEKPFKYTVLVPFPHLRSKVVAFFTGSAPKECEEKEGHPLSSVFIPTSPHPISGYVVMVQDEDIKKVDVPVEDVFKFLVSCGIHDFEKSPDSDLLLRENSKRKTR